LAEGNKTEKATPKKRNDERKKGNVFLSKDAVSVASLFGGILTLRFVFSAAVESMRAFMAYCISLTSNQSVGIPVDLLHRCTSIMGATVGPLALLIIVASVAATFAQTRFLVTGEVLKPKFNRISPLQGFKRIFSLRSIVEMVKNLFKIGILLYMIYDCLLDLIQVSANYLHAELEGSCIHLLEAVFSMLLKVSLAFLALAVADFFYQWWDYERQMRMSKQEVKEEYKQTEGDPQIKGKIKELQRRMAQSRMMQQVPGSDVVVRNPTHVAVALRYHPGEDEAPVVLAKGIDALALRIVKVAEEHNVTVLENVPLARALYAKSELNSQIPPDLYDEVAEVMVYLYKIGRIHTKARQAETGTTHQAQGGMRR